VTGPGLRIREASSADLAALDQVLGAIERMLGDFCEETGWPRRPVHAATRAAVVAGRAPGLRAFLAEDAAGAPLGFASTSFSWDLGDGPGAWLADLYVVPHARRAGVGRALVAAAARAAAADGATFLAWHVDDSNPGAQRFYRALGAAAKPSHVFMCLDLGDSPRYLTSREVCPHPPPVGPRRAELGDSPP
jgi:GNAT superfamily N-acetyltransferase